jgi:predicted lipoprotein with Yx(FWY)xxD motif
MRRPFPHLLICAAFAASLVFAACGGDDGSAASGAAHTVGVKHVDGLGAVLVDDTGKALYTPDQDRTGKIRCTGDCTTFWRPLDPGAGTPTAADGAGAVAVVQRPDGSRQVTADGRPLYTFSEDSAGAITGDGFHDAFGGRRFVWHVVLAGKGPAPTKTSGSGQYGY